jgi:SAM-dependent methyltransferase
MKWMQPKLLWFLALLLLVGGLSTGLWLGAVQFPQAREHLLSAPALVGVTLCSALTTINVLLRWFRWHFLIRRFTPQLVTRDSIATYLATLPAIITPFFVGELVRVWILRRRFHTPSLHLVRVWLTERMLDAAVLGAGLIWSLDGRWAAVAFPVLLLGSWVWFKRLLAAQPGQSAGLAAATAVLTTCIAWALPILALERTAALLAQPLGAVGAVRTFTAGTLFGGVTGLPLGVSVTGSTMIHELTRFGMSTRDGVVTILVVRAGTAWFALCLGLVSLVAYRKRLARLLRGEIDAHFDEIAESYGDEIPAHVRDLLLAKKVRHIHETLVQQGLPAGARGLDLGCGQAWYLAELTRLGYRVDGVDYSAGQLEKAAQHLRERGHGETLFVQADAQNLPLKDDTYDFVYSINAMHHILSPQAQANAFREIVRVLRPGGLLILHEINSRNPLFRFYMGYLFPLLKRIDEGNERWILPWSLPEVEGARWSSDVKYFTFLPDFVPPAAQGWLGALESWLERSRWRRFSAHYQACLVKDPAVANPVGPQPTLTTLAGA